MKSFIVLALLAAAVAAQVGRNTDAVVVGYNQDNIGVDGYNYAAETSNDINEAEMGVMGNLGAENDPTDIRGQFSYTGPDGVVYSVTYVADEKTFQVPQ